MLTKSVYLDSEMTQEEVRDRVSRSGLYSAINVNEIIGRTIIDAVINTSGWIAIKLDNGKTIEILSDMETVHSEIW